MKSKTLTFAITSIVLLSLTVIALVQNFGIGGWSYTKSERRYDGRFFRMVVKLDYHGEPQVFDFVVGCNVHSVVYKDNSSSRDVGLIPAVYGRRMKDGKGVVIRPPDVCNGETTAGGQVPPAFMPLIVVYDNADTLDQGLAYLSDDAYDSPLSDMKFGTAEIIASTREEFEVNGKQGTPNLLTREKFWSPQGIEVIKNLGLKPVLPMYAPTCYYARRIRLPEIVRARARGVWPASRPRFWYAKDFKEEQSIIENLFTTSDPRYFVQPELGGEPLDIDDFRRFRSPDKGMLRRTGKYVIAPTEISETGARFGPISAYYPVTSIFSERFWPKEHLDWPKFVNGLNDPAFKEIVTKNGATRGLAACWNVANVPYRVSPPDPIDEKTFAVLVRIPGHAEVDSEPVVSPANDPVKIFDIKMYIFENDEYLFELQNFDFGIMNGDVR